MIYRKKRINIPPDLNTPFDALLVKKINQGIQS
jgi:hypothetical protein